MTVEKSIQQNTLSSQVKNYILQLIVERKLTTGMPVPSEIQLIQELGVSRGVVREAYRSLSALGVLEIKSGKVPRIKKVDSNVLQFIFNFAIITEQVSVRDILVVRRMLEIETVRLAAINGTEDDFMQLKQETELMRKNFNNVNMYIQHDLQFHFILSNAAGNALVSILLRSLHQQLYDSMYAGIFAQKGKQKLESRIVDLHQIICDKVCQRDTDGAAEAMKNHFINPIDALIDKSE